METQVDEVIEVGHVELQPVERGVQVDLQAMANNIKPLLLFHNISHISLLVLELLILILSRQIIRAREQIWEGLQEVLADRDIVLLLLPLRELCLEILLLVGRHLRRVGVPLLKLRDVEGWLNKAIVPVGPDPDGVLLHISDMLIRKQLINFPKLFVVVLLNSRK